MMMRRVMGWNKYGGEGEHDCLGRCYIYEQIVIENEKIISIEYQPAYSRGMRGARGIFSYRPCDSKNCIVCTRRLRRRSSGIYTVLAFCAE